MVVVLDVRQSTFKVVFDLDPIEFPWYKNNRNSDKYRPWEVLSGRVLRATICW